MILSGKRRVTEKGAALQAMVANVPFWWHSIDLGSGVVTPGNKSPEQLRLELTGMQLPVLSGKTLLDIGAWDGFFSFAAEALGAKVTSLDYYEWSTDTDAKMRYWRTCKERGEDPRPYREVPGLWQPDRLPGKRGFDTAKRALGSSVKEVVADFTTVDLDELGTFDVVLFLGVLYHLREPLTALERLAKVTNELAIIETSAVSLPEIDRERCMFEFFPGAELNGDPTNWWTPTRAGLEAACRAAGFAGAAAISPEPQQPGQYRLTVHAWR